MSKSTYINYKTLENCITKITDLKKNLEQLKINVGKEQMDYDYASIKIPTFEEAKKYCKSLDIYKFTITPDIREARGDYDYRWNLQWGKGFKVIKDSSEAIPYQKEQEVEDVTSEGGGFAHDNRMDCFTYYPRGNGMIKLDGYFGNKIRYNIQSLEDTIKGISDRGCSIWEPLDRDKKKVKDLIKYLNTGKEKCSLINKLVKEYNRRINDVISSIDTETEYIVKIYDAYKAFEKSAKNKFEGNKTGKKYSKTEIAKKYAALVSAAGAKNAKKYLSKILKKTNSKVTSAEVLSIYKKYKNEKKISGNLNSKEEKDTKRTKKSSSKSSSTTTAMAATGATVAATKVKKSAKSSSTKDTKKTSKKTKTKVKQGVLTTVPTLATLKAMKKQLKSNTTIKLSNIKTEANNKIVAIEGKAEDQKKLAEIEKNNTIKQINENAASKIGAIDANDSEANTKIENIQKEAEEEIEKTNTAYENKVNEIEEKKNKDIAQVNSDKNNATKDVEEKSNKELKEINDDIEKAKKTKSSKKSTTTKVSSEATEKKTESKEYKSTVNDSSVETSEQAANDSSTKLDEAVNTKQEEITSAEQAKIDAADSVTDNSSSDSSANVAQPETSSTPEQTTSASVDDIDTSSSDTGYSSSSNYDASSYNNNSSSTDYSTVDETKQSNVNSSNTGVDQSTLHTDSTTKSTFDIKKDTTSSISSSNKDIDDISSISSTKSTSSKKSSGLGAAVPIGLGIAATGAAAVAGVRYVKNKKLNEDYDENYDDENNDVYNDEVPSDSAYMADDYLGPEGSSYTEVPDDNEYTDAEALEEEAGVSDFSEDAALNELN